MTPTSDSWRSLAWAEVRAGWRVLLACTIGVAAGAAALPFYTAGVFIAPLEHAFGWSRSAMAEASMAWTITVVVCAPFVGGLLDRFGVRGLASLSLLALGGTFFALSRLDGQLWVYLVIQVCGAATGIPSTPVAFTRAVNERFDHARGAALGLTLAGTGITAALAPSFTAAVVEANGWRSGFLALAAIALCSAPLVFLLLGKRRNATQAASSAAAESAPFSLKGAVRTPVFWRLLTAFFCLALGVSGWVLHTIPMMTDAGLSLAEAARIQGTLGIAVVAGRLGIGALADHFFAPRLASLTLGLTAVGMVALATGGTGVAGPAAFAIGFALGAEVDLIGYLTARYFGLAAYGRLYGVLYGAFVLGTGLSPVLIAKLQAVHTSYSLPLGICAGLVGTTILLFVTAPAFERTRSAA